MRKHSSTYPELLEQFTVRERRDVQAVDDLPPQSICGRYPFSNTLCITLRYMKRRDKEEERRGKGRVGRMRERRGEGGEEGGRRRYEEGREDKGERREGEEEREIHGPSVCGIE